ncbi:MAG: hypothetical protein ABH950_01785 [Candidatus Altiarchaeota archaeon]
MIIEDSFGKWMYGYDDVGNLIWQSDNRGWNTSFSYKLVESHCLSWWIC